MIDRKTISQGQQKLVVKGQPVEFSVPIFQNYLAPAGFLDEYLESHALFYYYLCAIKAYAEYIATPPIVYEGDPDPEVNFRQLFTSIARMYQVETHHMVNAWPQVDLQARALEMPALPNEERYRFDKKVILLS